jgi:hypothetical protein
MLTLEPLKSLLKFPKKLSTKVKKIWGFPLLLLFIEVYAKKFTGFIGTFSKL